MNIKHQAGIVLKKITSVFSIITIILGTSFASINSANAADTVVSVDDTWDSTLNNALVPADDIIINNLKTLTLTDQSITGLGSAAGVITLGSADAAAAATLEIDQAAPLTIDRAIDEFAAAVLGAININDNAEGAAPDTVTFSGIVGGTFPIGALTVGTQGGEGGHAIFSAAASFGTIAVSGGEALEVAIAEFKGAQAGAITLNSESGEADARVTISGTSDQTIAGTINGGGDGEGTLSVTNTGGTVTFTGAIGTTADLLSVSTAASTTSVFNEAVDTVGLTQAGTATFKKAVGGITTATLTGDTTFQDTLTATTVDVNSGTQTFSKLVDSNKLDVAGASTVVNIDFAPDLEQLAITAGTVNISVKNVNIDDLDLDGGSIVIKKTVLASEAVFLVSSQATAGVGSAGKIYLPVNLQNGTSITLFDDSGTIATSTASVDAVLQDTALTDYTASLSSGDMLVTSTNKSAATTAQELGVTVNDAKALLQLRDAVISDTNLDGNAEDAVFNALNAQGGFSATEDTALAKQAAPQTDLVSGSTFATKAMTGTVQGIVASRMASLRSGDAYVSGVATGNDMSANSMFLQAFGSMSEQDNKRVGSGTQFGYEADTAGLAIGADGLLSNGSVLGLSLSMSNTDVDGKGTGRAKNDIDSYTASLYMDKATAAGYIEGSLTYGINENSSSRIINTAGLNRTYSADYDSDQISLKIGGGIPNDIGDNTFITPFGSLTATKISTDAYTEKSNTSGDNLRLRVAQDDVDSYVGTIGIKAHKVTDQGTPMISLAINNEFGDNTINSTNTYQGGGTAFKTSTDVEELSATLALGYKFGSDKLSFTLGYEATANDDDYLSHYGSAKLVSKF